MVLKTSSRKSCSREILTAFPKTSSREKRSIISSAKGKKSRKIFLKH